MFPGAYFPAGHFPASFFSGSGLLDDDDVEVVPDVSASDLEAWALHEVIATKRSREGFLDPKHPDEKDYFAFNFRRRLKQDGTEKVVSAQCFVSVEIGADAGVGSMKVGSALIASPRAYQRIVGGVEGVTYYVKCVAVTDLPRTIVIDGLLPVRRLVELA